MRKFVAAARKEMLLLVRDKIGLGILFVMPMVLIFVMTLIQDAAFRTLNNEGLPILFVNNDHDTLGNRVEAGLKSSGICQLHESIDDKLVTEEDAVVAVKEGKFLLAIVIPEGATNAIRSNVSDLVALSMGEAESESKDSTEIQLIIDPVASKNFVTSVTSNLREFISSVKTQIMFESFNDEITQLIPDGDQLERPKYGGFQAVRYNEIYASEMTGSVIPNAVQHNVPAWTIFAMFFIVIPLVGSVMKEKSEGSVFRFHILPVSYFVQINAKLMVYAIVCMIQFLLMLGIGVFILPLIGLPALTVGNSILGVFAVAMATSLAASGYGVVVGALAGTQQQGAILGSLSVLVLSALGGIWVPAYIMPETMRTIAEFSPLNWALDGFYGLFLRGEGIIDVMGAITKLLIFFVACVVISVFVSRKKLKS